jgi:hypothetical protein
MSTQHSLSEPVITITHDDWYARHEPARAYGYDIRDDHKINSWHYHCAASEAEARAMAMARLAELKRDGRVTA